MIVGDRGNHKSDGGESNKSKVEVSEQNYGGRFRLIVWWRYKTKNLAIKIFLEYKM